MNIYGSVKSEDNNEPLQGVTISVLSSQGVSKGDVGQTNPSGAFAGDYLPTDKLRFSHVGFVPSILPVSYFENGNTVYLRPTSAELPEVIVTPNKPTNTLLWIAAAFIAGKALKLF